MLADIDECLDSSVCSGGGSTCVNEVGSYRCECSNGYLRNTDDMTCKGTFVHKMSSPLTMVTFMMTAIMMMVMVMMMVTVMTMMMLGG